MNPGVGSGGENVPDGGSPLPPEYLFYLQYHLVRQREIELSKVLAGLKLTIPKWRILSTLARLGSSTMGEVADFCVIDRTTLTRIIDQLVAVGYIDRVSARHDRRQTLLDLTGAGRGAYDSAVAAVVEFNFKAMDGVDPADAEVLERVLRQVVRNVIDDDQWADSVLQFQKGCL